MATFIRFMGRSSGGGGISSPSSLRARARAVMPNLRTASVDNAHSGPLSSVGTMSAMAATASGRLARA